MDILTNVLLPIALALIVAVPGLAGIWLFASQRAKQHAEADATVVKTALSLIAPLEERLAKQSLFIDELQSEVASGRRLLQAREEVIASMAAQLVRLGGTE